MSIRTHALAGFALVFAISACADESAAPPNGVGVSLPGPHENLLLSVDPSAPEPEVLDLGSVLSADEISALGQDQDKTVFAGNTRTRVANSGISPYRSYVKVIVQWQANQQAKACSGTLIRSDAVLTNAHCIYNTALGTNGLPYRIQVIPGAYTNAADVNNTLQVPATGFAWVGKTFAPWTNYQANEADLWARVPYDYAVLRTQTAFASSLPVIPYGVHPQPLNEMVKVTGYHFDLSSGNNQYTSTDRVRQVKLAGQLLHKASTAEQSSGSPITGASTWVDKLYALNTGEATLSGVAYNVGTTITSGIKANIDAWAVAVWR